MNLQADGSQSRFSHRRKLEDLLQLQEDSGYIEGKVFMTWPLRNGLHRIILEVIEDSALHRFQVEIPHSDGVSFLPHERVCFSLKGMRVDRCKESSAPHYFPIALRFTDGIVLKYLSGRKAGKLVDTRGGNVDEWYEPGVLHTTPDAGSTNASEIHHGPALTSGCPPMPTAIVPQNNEPLPPEVASPFHEAPTHAFLTSVNSSHRQLHQASAHTSSGSSTSVGNRVDVVHENDHDNTVTVPGEVVLPTVRLKAGICTQKGDIFTALGELQKGGSLINIIGVVTEVTQERRTRTNEWSRSITLVDPSLVNSSRRGITVNCFHKKCLESLPQVQKDDVVILRKLKVVEFKGAVTATGYGDKLRWAVYDPLKHAMRPPNKTETELIDDRVGYEYPSYWEQFHDSFGLEYCRQLGQWWRAFEGKKGYTLEGSASMRRQHLLISEASPDLPPRGFFDCTVEVLQKFDNHAGATSVYVTDYTANTLVHPVKTTWCPPQLSGCVLQCNMWDDARDVAKMMNAGEYWYLNNVRARWNPNHYMEGTMQLAEKVTQLDENKLEGLPYLRALLERKREFGLGSHNPPLGLASPYVFPEMLLQDVDGSTSFLTCIVELLHIDLSSDGGPFLYVTDYTHNPDLPSDVPAGQRMQSLEHRVVKVKLDDAQANVSSDLRLGCTHLIQNMRIDRLGVSGGIRGCLGGGEALIVSLNDSSSHWGQRLQRNKEKWKRENVLNVPRTLSNRSQGETCELLKQSWTILGKTTLQEALARAAPAMFKVLARAVDFYPFSLEDACVPRCTKCEPRSPSSSKGCPRCDDATEVHRRWFYCLYILLQDEQGTELTVSLSGKECTLLQGVDPTDFRSDRMAFGKFLEKLDPILGNLRSIHLAWSRNEDADIESPLMVFILESWNVGQEKGYGLRSCSSI